MFCLFVALNFTFVFKFIFSSFRPKHVPHLKCKASVGGSHIRQRFPQANDISIEKSCNKKKEKLINIKSSSRVHIRENVCEIIHFYFLFIGLFCFGISFLIICLLTRISEAISFLIVRNSWIFLYLFVFVKHFLSSVILLEYLFFKFSFFFFF